MSKIFKPAAATTALPYAASASVAISYAAYRLHDRRDLSAKEAEAAHRVLAAISPNGSTAQHLSNLDKFGASVIKETLSPAMVAKWNTRTKEAFAKNANNNIAWNSGRAHFSISKRSQHEKEKQSNLFEEMAKIGSSHDNNSTSVAAAAAAADQGFIGAPSAAASSSGSKIFGIFLRKNKQIIDNSQTISCQKEEEESPLLQDIVKSYFEQHKIKRYELTDVQFLNAYPDSTNQVWHRDNTCCGLTVIVALKNVRSNGPTELLAGSHRRDFSLWNVFRSAFFESNEALAVQPGQPLLGCLNSGDAILYDARTFHRGRGYSKSSIRESDLDRPVLVLRWDAPNTPPPGAGLIKTTANAVTGCFLYAALSVIHK